MNAAERTEWVVERARALGFDLCGVAPAEGLEELARLPEWLERGHAGEMRYLEDPRRLEPARVVPGARSLIVCALNYNTPLPYSTEVPVGGGLPHLVSPAERPGGIKPPLQEMRGWISRYAWGDDYHQVLGEKLEALLAAMREAIAEPFEARAYVDTGPVVERVAAKHAGLGWLAKNTCLIHEKLGSWLFLGVIVTTLELEPSLAAGMAPPPDLCGNCTLCIEACPTGAIVEPYLLDARRCISYLTIELRGSIPEEFRPAMGRHVFGCDICQDVCPWNRKAPVTALRQFLPRSLAAKQETRKAKLETRGDQSSGRSRLNGGMGSEPQPTLDPPEESLFAASLEWVASLSEEEFRQVFRGSAVKRAKWRGLVRNACVALGNSRGAPGTPAHARIRRLLERLAASEDSLIAEHARWGLGRLEQGVRG